MLAFTPEVTHALAWFKATHVLTAEGFGRVTWSPRWLPGPGSIGEQDARLMDALDLLRQVHDELLQTTTANEREDHESDG